MYVDDVSSTLKKITVIVCWRQGDRVIGEDWVFDNNPDILGQSRPSSPVTVSTLMTDR